MNNKLYIRNIKCIETGEVYLNYLKTFDAEYNRRIYNKEQTDIYDRPTYWQFIFKDPDKMIEFMLKHPESILNGK